MPDIVWGYIAFIGSIILIGAIQAIYIWHMTRPKD